MSENNLRSNTERIIKVAPKTFATYNYNMGYYNIGDIVYETHFPDRIGVILKISRYFATVRWQPANLYSFNYTSNLETLEVVYLEKVEGEIILNDFDEPAPEKPVKRSQRRRKKYD